MFPLLFTASKTRRSKEKKNATKIGVAKENVSTLFLHHPFHLTPSFPLSPLITFFFRYREGSLQAKAGLDVTADSAMDATQVCKADTVDDVDVDELLSWSSRLDFEE